MKLNVKTDLRVFLAKIVFSFVTWILICVAFYFYHKKLYISPLISFAPGLVTNGFDFIFQRKVYLNNSYLYLKQNRDEPNPLKDIPIKPDDISGYHLNNPFPEFSKWCDASKNITLFLKNGKHVVFSAKDQDLFLSPWLKENFIREESTIPKRGIIETTILTATNLGTFLFFLYLFNSANLPKYGLSYLIASGICLSYSLIYVVSGIILIRKNQIDSD